MQHLNTIALRQLYKMTHIRVHKILPQWLQPILHIARVQYRDGRLAAICTKDSMDKGTEKSYLRQWQSRGNIKCDCWMNFGRYRRASAEINILTRHPDCIYIKISKEAVIHKVRSKNSGIIAQGGQEILKSQRGCKRDREYVLQ